MITPQSIVVAAPDQVSSDLAGEAVILNLGTGMYYGLDEVGARVWSLVQQPCAVEALRDAILAEYEVDPERCERDLLELLADLEAARLVEVAEQSASTRELK